MTQSKNQSEVKLYRWPLGLRQQFVTKGGMFFRVSIYAASLVLFFCLGLLWGTSEEPTSARLSQDERVENDTVRQCCFKDIRTAQEALTKLSVDAQKLRLRLAGAGKNGARTEIVSSVGNVEERAMVIWDQLESLLQDSSDRRRKLRDIRINLEGLKEHFQTIEVCCGPPPEAWPSLKHYLQTAELRFQAMQAKVSPAYIEGEMSLAYVAHETGYNYVLRQEFDAGGDTTNAPKASNLKIYEDGVALGPAHSPHAEIRQLGRGRYSHWEDSLYFSTSDNSDPTTNKRRYTYRSYSSPAIDPQASGAATADAISLQ
ncbi:MAG: hypothetical protein M3Z35_13415 [Nitrospirota bacterium]|nr:hypothetical protein [Nitrospirota bacterium]